MTEPPRLSDYLDEDKLSLDDLKRDLPSQQYLPTRLLGAEPLSGCYAAINPTTLQVRDVIIPAFLHIPFCDLGMGIDGSLRSCVMFASSQAMGCAYCQAHSIGFGTLGRGAGLFIDKVAKAANLGKNGDEFTAGEIAALEMAHAVGSVPSTVTLQHRINLAKHFAAKNIEPVIYPGILMAWLTRFMDTIGVPLEGPAYEIAEGLKDQIGWEAGKHVIETKDTERIKEEIEKKANGRGNNPLFSRLVLLRHVIAAKMADGKVKKGIPDQVDLLDDHMKQKWGFCPYYLPGTKDAGMRSAISFMILRGLTEDQNPNTPASLKWKICFLQACRVGSSILQAHFAFLAVNSGSSPDELGRIRRSDFSSFSVLDQAALKFAELTAGPAPFSMDKDQMEDFTKSFTSAEVVDLVCTTAIFSALRASTAAFPPAKYEDEIQQFVEREEVKALVDYVAKWEDWDAEIESALSAEASDCTSSAVEEATQAVGSTASTAAEKISDAKSAVAGATAEASSDIKNASTDAVNASVQAAESLAESASKAASETKEAILADANATGASVVDNMKPTLDDGVNSAKEAAGNGLAAAKSIGSSAKAKATDVKDTAVTKANEASASAADCLNQAADSGKAAGQKAKNKAASTASAVSSEVEKKAKETSDALDSSTQ